MPNSNGQNPVVQPKLLPVVRRVIQQLDVLYIDYAGAAAKNRLEDIYSHWLTGGRTGPSGLREYVQTLGAQLNDPGSRATFTQQAERLLIHLQSGYAH